MAPDNKSRRAHVEDGMEAARLAGNWFEPLFRVTAPGAWT
jgi:hypothetical protein